MEKDNLDHIRHSLAHVLAAAVLEIFPDAKLGIGPAIDSGFYYDFELPRPLTPEDLPVIEKNMRALLAKHLSFEGKELTLTQARTQFAKQPFKLELINDLERFGTTIFDDIQKKDASSTTSADRITSYTMGVFTDLCRGGHVRNTKEIAQDAFTLTHIAGAYWRGDETRPMLQRIYGAAFKNKAELKSYLIQQEEAKKRDHRKIGEQLNLFVFADLVGKGLPLLTPKGTAIRKELEKFVTELEQAHGYEHVITPPLAKVDLFKTSGHYPYYKDSMYPVMKIDEEELILRPMTCPHHFMLYASSPHSYRELPIRYAEISPQFRYEKSGELSGLMRVRMFMLADAHLFCRPDQVKKEIANALMLIDEANAALGFKKGTDYWYRLSLGDRTDEKKYYKDDAAWETAEGILRDVLKETNNACEEAVGEAAFYGPKIDVQIKKVNGQSETAFTVQYDFVMPKRFNLRYIDEHGVKQEVVVIHRSSIGAFERTMAFLIEKYAGAFPLWLSPIQVGIISVSDSHISQAQALSAQLTKHHIRTKIFDANETVGYKIRSAEKEKIPYIVVLGDKEVASGELAVRSRGKRELVSLPADALIKKIREEIQTRA